MNKNLKPIDFNGYLLDRQEQWLEDNSQAVFYSEIECLEWDYFDEMSHVIEEYNGTYYILEYEDLKEFKNTFL